MCRLPDLPTLQLLPCRYLSSSGRLMCRLTDLPTLDRSRRPVQRMRSRLMCRLTDLPTRGSAATGQFYDACRLMCRLTDLPTRQAATVPATARVGSAHVPTHRSADTESIRGKAHRLSRRLMCRLTDLPTLGGRGLDDRARRVGSCADSPICRHPSRQQTTLSRLGRLMCRLTDLPTPKDFVDFLPMYWSAHVPTHRSADTRRCSSQNRSPRRSAHVPTHRSADTLRARSRPAGYPNVGSCADSPICRHQARWRKIPRNSVGSCADSPICRHPL